MISLFEGDCGHEWVAETAGSFTCPVCGRYDGDHHLISQREVAFHFDHAFLEWLLDPENDTE